MKDGVCVKCDSVDVYFNNSTGSQTGIVINRGSALLNIYKDNKWVPDVTMLEFSHYVCRDCGYLESYVKDTAQLEKLEDCSNWKKMVRRDCG